MTAKKTPEERLTRDQKKSGGKRTGSGRKAKLMDPNMQLEWDQELTRAISAASANMGVIKKDSFWTLRELQARWGKLAGAEFKDWFEATKHLDQQFADQLLHEHKTGRITEDKYKDLLFTKAFTWYWSIRSEKSRAAWELTRGLKPLR
jgi:hypothetical protein